jgi:hypothetical protein
MTPSVSSKGRRHRSEAVKGLADDSAGACTGACTSDAENANGDPLQTLARALRSLSAEEWERLAAMLGERGTGETSPGGR